MVKKFISMCMIFAMITPMLLLPAFATEAKEKREENLPPGVELLEGEVWVPASEGIETREAPNAACLKTDHLPPQGYRYVGYKRGDTRVENLQATVSGFLVSLIVPDLGLLVGVIGVGIAVDGLDSVVSGTYTEYMWSNGNKTWSHVVGYAEYESNGTTYYDYVNCEVKHY